MTDPLHKSPANARATAARIVASWLTEGQFPDRMLEANMADRAFVTELVLGIVRRYRTLDWYRGTLVPRRPVAEIDACLLVGLYQLLFLSDVQEYAAVNETVEAAKDLGGRKAAGLVNAVLRRAQTGKTAFFQTLEKQPAGVRLSHPEILLDRWTRQFGRDNAARLCEWNNRTPDTVLRVNTAQTDAAKCLRAFLDAGVGAGPHPFDPSRFILLPHGARIKELPGFGEGWFMVQDPATSISTDLLAAKPGERILDACAAPGGKTIALAAAMNGEGELVAADTSPYRLTILRENLARTKFENFVKVADGAAAGLFDAILLDVPCTNSGVIRRRPDARWRFSRERLQTACEQQREILNATASLVSPCGRIVYSTCSLEPEENGEMVGAWISAHPEFELKESRALFPPDSETDGAYAALLVRK